MCRYASQATQKVNDQDKQMYNMQLVALCWELAAILTFDQVIDSKAEVSSVLQILVSIIRDPSMRIKIFLSFYKTEIALQKTKNIQRNIQISTGILDE